MTFGAAIAEAFHTFNNPPSIVVQALPDRLFQAMVLNVLFCLSLYKKIYSEMQPLPHRFLDWLAWAVLQSADPGSVEFMARYLLTYITFGKSAAGCHETALQQGAVADACEGFTPLTAI